MPEFHMESAFAVPVDELFAYHQRPGAFDRLVPPWVQLTKVAQSGTIGDGDVLEFDIHQGPLKLRWRAEHEDFLANRRFVDRQARGPFAYWRHVHGFEPQGTDHSKLSDHVTYRLPLGPIGSIFGGPFFRADLQRLFRFRHQRTGHDLMRHNAVTRAPQTIVFIGRLNRFLRKLAAFLTVGGHRVCHMAPAAAARNQPWVFHALGGPALRYPLEEADLLLHSGLPYEEHRDPELTFAYLADLAGLLDVAGNRDCRLLQLHGFARSLDHFISEPFINFEAPKPRQVADSGDQLPHLLAKVSSRTDAYLGCMIGADMADLTNLLLRLESYVFLADGRPTPEFYWIGEEDALGGLLWLIQHPEHDGDVCVAHRQPTTRAELQRRLIKRRFFGYSGHRILKVLPWARPGLPAGMNSDLGKLTMIEDVGFTPLAADLDGTLDMEEGRVMKAL